MARRVNPLVRFIPPFLVRFFARPYVAGDSLAKALDVVAELARDRKLMSTLDLLAEDIETAEVARRNVETYLRMIDSIAADPRLADGRACPSVSLKLSSYTTAPLDAGGDAQGSAEAAFEIADRAKQRGVPLTVDMESRHWVDFTLDLLNDLWRAGYREVGGVLQTRLDRTEADLDRLPPGCRVRLVIGIYQEPADVAATDKRVMKQRMLDYAGRLLERGHYVEFATHDEPWVRRFIDEVVPAARVDTDRFEVQMLYGVPRQRLLEELIRRGVPARLYVPFALSWSMAIAYLRRRLDEYPAMMFVVLKNLLSRG